MKILWFYQYFRAYNYDHFLHMDVAECMNGIDGIDVRCYGPGLHITNPNLIAVQYDPCITMAELYERFAFDTVVICTKSRMFGNYLPKHGQDNTRGEIRENPWLPKDFATFDKAPKFVFEEDYHYEDQSNEWYLENNIAAILQRHWFNTQDVNHNVKQIFFPFSVDTKTFYDKGLKRKNKISFAGSINNKYYTDRKIAIKRLKDAGVFADRDSYRIEDENYVLDLNSYVSHLSAQSAYYILPAKIYEIAACGSVLLTNSNTLCGIQHAFPDNCYVSFKDDCSDVVEKAKQILLDGDLRAETSKNAKLHVLSNHTHEIRAQQFISIRNSA